LRQNQVAGIGVGSCTPANASSADFSFDRSFEALWTPCVHASHMLPRLMAHYRPRRLVEVGVCTGMTSITAMIAAHRLDHSLQNYFMVDPWRAPSCVPGCGCFKELLRVAAHVPAMTLLRGYSLPSARMIPNASLDLAYIDAAHKYNSAREDILAYLPKVHPGGVIGGHDASHVLNFPEEPSTLEDGTAKHHQAYGVAHAITRIFLGCQINIKWNTWWVELTSCDRLPTQSGASVIQAPVLR